MPYTSTILTMVLAGKSKKEINDALAKGHNKISLFKLYIELNNKNLFNHLRNYTKLKSWTLNDFISAGAVDLTEKDEDNITLMQQFIVSNDIEHVKILLMHGITLTSTEYDYAGGVMQAFLDYRPGKDQKTIFELCSKRVTDKNKLTAIFDDYANTTEGESSEAELESQDELSETEQIAYLKRSNDLSDPNKLSLVAARGVHFSPKYYSSQAVEKVKTTKNHSFASFSQFTLFDSGYTADDEVDESDKKIKKRDLTCQVFTDTLKNTPDRDERRIGHVAPCRSRNNHTFDNLYYRYMQVYIMSYNHLFNLRSIQIDFGFESNLNPEVSASWYFDKAAMYGSGFRFDWKQRGIRKDPHYRRSTGAPKHPNLGYLDVYAFDIDYVRTYGFDRLLECAKGHIHLSAFYRHEGEVIFHSLIPAKYHVGRYIISLPSFNVPQSKEIHGRYGITATRTYNAFKNDIQTLPADKQSDAYAEVINKLTKHAVNAQALQLENTVHCRLFRDKKKIVVYDHGDKVKIKPFTL